MRSSGATLRGFVAALTSNRISLLGTAITTASALPIVTLFVIDVMGYLGNPYVGILAYLILPGVFLFGLLLIPFGIIRVRRRARRAGESGEPTAGLPVIDLNRDRTRRWVLITLSLTATNVVILAVATYKGVEVMDSTKFCGTTCHSVMQPEYTTYSRSPHARVHCVSCHIGPGADWFVKSKLSGAWQVVAVAFDLYPRPIPTPVHNLRPARETCEQCHWPAKFAGDLLEIRTHYQDDEANSETKTVLLLRVGGVQGGQSHGIHWHVDPAVRIRYHSDPGRETIDAVELTRADGTVKTFTTGQPVANTADVAAGWRVMDCVDCHNRPTHIYRTPEQELDDALRQAHVSRALPYIRRQGLEALRRDYPSHAAAREGIAAEIASYYREHHPEVATSSAALIEQAGRALGEIYATNVFPSMKVTWGTYPSFLGHRDDGGCFRCHDGSHVAPDGSSISQDCDTCHTLLAVEEPAPEILAQLQP